ncbi:hypothetical protein, partial [Thiorhodococcus minor]|uniref:hypothetical protein n=1 Tax=Thiorhodococcus minor TaxID=57489 RepID=UPI001ADCE622
MRLSFPQAGLWMFALFTLPMVLLPTFAVGALPQGRIDEAVLAQAPDRYSFPPLFVPNRGQWSAGLAFVARTAEADVLFSDRDAVIVLPGEGGARSEVRMWPLGAAPRMRVTHGDPLP